MAGWGRKTWIVNGVALAVFLGGVGVYVTRDSEPEPAKALEDLPALLEAPFAVALSGPPGGRAALGQPVTVAATVGGADVDEVQLWDGGALVAAAAPEDRGGTALTWPPLAAGQHLLTVRATSGAGKVASSAPVSVEVLSNGYQPALPTPVAPIDGDETGQELADRLQVDPARLVIVAPDGHTTPVDLSTTLPIPPPGSAIAVTLTGTEKVADRPTLAAAPGALISDIDLRDCAVELAVDADDGATVGESTAGTPGYAVLGQADGGSFTTQNLAAGPHLFAISAGGTLSTPVLVNMPTTCTEDDLWSGDASLVDGILTMPKALDHFYLYLAVDDLPARRIPGDDASFLSSITPRVDISGQIPGVEGGQLHLEVWQQVDQSAALVASGDASVPKGTSVADLIGEPTAIDLTMRAPSNAAVKDLTLGKDREIQLTWHSDSPRVTQVVWQVLAQPLSPGNTDLVTPLLLAGGLSAAGSKHDGVYLGSGQTGGFSFDTIDLPRAGTEPPATGTADEQAAVAALSSFTTIDRFDPITTKEPVFAQPLDVSDLASAGEVDQALAGLGPAAASQVYVRVIPIAGYQPVSDASPLVTISLPAPGTTLRLDITDATLDVGSAPSLDFWNCTDVVVPWKGVPPGGGRVTGEFLRPVLTGPLPDGSGGPGPIGVDKDYDFTAPLPGAPEGLSGYNPSGTYALLYPTSGVYCAGDSAAKGTACNGDVFCYASKAAGAVLKVLSTIWDVVSGTYNLIKSSVVAFIAKYNPFCGLATIASKSAGKTCEEVASVVIDVAISAVMVAYGIPPSLPSSAEVIDIAQGDLAALGSELLQQMGVPCDELADTPAAGAVAEKLADEAGVPKPTAADGTLDPCKAVLEAAIKQVRTQVTFQAGQALTLLTGMPFPPSAIPGFSVTDDPRGSVQPAQVTLTGTRTDPEGGFWLSCPVTVSPTPGAPGAVFAPESGTLVDVDLWGPKKTYTLTVLLDDRKPTSASDYDISEGQAVAYSVSGASCLGRVPSLLDKFTTPIGPNGQPDPE